MSARAFPRLALAGCVAALAAAAPAAASFERCCFSVEVEASGRVSSQRGTLAWRWTLRHVARYSEHGRIFNALTAVEGVGTASVLRGSFRSRSPSCFERTDIRRFEHVPGAYASLEDNTNGRVVLVARAGTAGHDVRRCGYPSAAGGAGMAGPWEYEIRAPAGEELRRGRLFAVSAEPAAGGRSSTIIARFRYFPRSELAAELDRLAAVAAIPAALQRAR